jgi:pyruvate dehydrogenase phosphatase
LTNEEVVGLLGMWLNRQDKGKEEGVTRDQLPVQMGEDHTVMYRYWGAEKKAEKKFVNIDDNAATHLARNALGGADKDLLGGLLTLEAPMSRNYR